MTPDHGARDHATWSASATERNWNCAGALALTADMPEETSEAADWGTVCHQISEVCLRTGQDADSFTGKVLKGKKYEFEVDDEMAETAQTYVDYVRRRAREAEKQQTVEFDALAIEQRFSLADLNPPFDAGGTADAIIYFQLSQELEVIDLKGGRGVRVSADENKQLLTYALGAMLANKGLPVKTVRSTIVQPRVSKEPKTAVYHTADLLEWSTDLLAAMRNAKRAIDEKPKTDEASWARTWLAPGAHCHKTFCKAQATCPALRQKVFDEAGVWFAEDDTPRLANEPDKLTVEMLAQALDVSELIEGWLTAVRGRAHNMADTGTEIPGYMLVDKHGRDKWTAEDKTVSTTLKALGVVIPTVEKLPTPKQAIKKIGDKNKAKIAALYKEAPITGTNLVRRDSTTRTERAPSVQKFFSPLD